MTDTNVNGFIEIANWAFNYFVQQGYGQLATISSIAANRGSSYSPAYAA
jgi:NADP-dependent 3-hydroxy acid dehydrogenase YdfG